MAKGGNTKIRLKGYTAPPPSGISIQTIDPAATLGPVQRVVHSQDFTSVLINSWWINVWASS